MIWKGNLIPAGWQANMDIQPVFNEFKAVTYMCQYLFKTENQCSQAMKQGAKPVGTQCPEDVPFWSYFGLDIMLHNRTKLGCIKFLTYFGSAMSDITLESRNIEKIS